MSENPEQNTSESEQEVILSTEDAEKVKDLEKELEEKNAKIENLEKSSKNSDDIAPGIRKTYEFGGRYRNAYEDGSYKKVKEKAKEEKAKMQVNQ